MYYYADNHELILPFQQIYRCSTRMVLSLRTTRADAPHQWCGGRLQSLKVLIFPNDNNQFNLKKGYGTSKTKVGCKQKAKSYI